MNLTSPGAVGSVLEVRGARASSVILQRIPPDAAEAFLQWQRGISAAAAEFPGYQTTEVYPPALEHQQWVVVIHFDDSQTLQDWLDSARRAEWIANLPCEIRDFELKTLPSGFGAWFAGLAEDGRPIPHWKMFLTVLFGLYPTVTLLTLSLSPYTQRFGLAVALLIGNIASVSLMEWLLMPTITRVIAPWLRANKENERRLSLVGLALIVGALGMMTFLFYLMTNQHAPTTFRS